MSTPEPSPGFAIAFVVLVCAVAAGFVVAVHRGGRRPGEPAAATRRRTVLAALGAALWLGATAGAARVGLLAFGPLPPPMLYLLLASFGASFAIAFSPLGARLAHGLPLAVLVGFQCFRIPVEILLHQGALEGFVPLQMTWLGLNYDVATGLGAALVAALLGAGRMPRAGVWLWNAIGLALLLNVVAVAILSFPTPLRAFPNEPANLWVSRAPWVWLPAVLVQAALLGHLLVWIRLAPGEAGGR